MPNCRHSLALKHFSHPCNVPKLYFTKNLTNAAKRHSTALTKQQCWKLEQETMIFERNDKALLEVLLTHIDINVG